MKRLGLGLGGILLSGFIALVLYGIFKNRPVEATSSATTAVAGLTNPPKSTALGRQYTVLLDVSTSRPKAMVVQGRQFVGTLVDQMQYGDKLTVLEMYEAGVKDLKPDLDVPLNKPEDVTSLEEKERLDGARKGIKDAVDLFFQNALKKSVVHTDIFTTLSIASEKMSAEKHDCLILLSDMLQSSKEFEFEHLQRMPSSAWIDEQKQQGLIRPLYGSSIVVIGADPSTREGVVVREFWRKYFAESNASLATEHYRTTPPSDAAACN